LAAAIFTKLSEANENLKKLQYDPIKLIFFLKVPKREIFDRSDFPDFYTIKSLHVGDFGVKIKKILQNF
jgi:hypothetical protein